MPGLEHLKGLPELQEFSLTATKITDAGLEGLRRRCRTAGSINEAALHEAVS